MSSPTHRFAIAALLLLALSSGIEVTPSLASQAIDGIWSELDANAPAPSARREYAAVFDRVHRRYVVFAGFTNELGNGYYLFNEVWTLDLGPSGPPTWSHLELTGTIPGGRHTPQWGYDPARNRILVFGGYGSHYPESPYAYLNDVWELSLDGQPEWNEIFPSGTPPAGRLAGAAVYDVLRQRFVGFGGTVGLPVDTWQLDLGHDPSWSTIDTQGVQPNGGYGMASIYDAARDRMIVFGGSIDEGYFGTHNDTWELDLRQEQPQWRQLGPAGPLPPARRTMAAVFDPRRDRMIVFGGWDGTATSTAFLNDTWALSLSAADDGAWTQLAPGGIVPGVRDAMSAAYDRFGDRMVVFGGWSGSVVLDDTQFLTWADVGQAASVTASGAGEPSAARLEWSTANTIGSIGAVYRREPGTEWTSLATVEADVAGLVQFEDHDVVPGGDYGYLIVVSSEVGDEFTGEVWVTVPTTTDATPHAAFALHAVRPNPVVGELGVSFALPNASPARLEMVDVSGRRVLTRAVGRGAGQHHLVIGDAGDYAAGVYFLQLTQKGRTVSTRVVLTGVR